MTFILSVVYDGSWQICLWDLLSNSFHHLLSSYKCNTIITVSLCYDQKGITVGIQPMPGFHSHGLHAPVHEENGSRQPRQAVLVSLVIQTLSLL